MMKFLELEKELSKRRLPCYNIFGEDDYLQNAALKKLLAFVTVFPDMNINFMGEKATGLEIKESCELLPMMGDVRIVAAEAAALKKNDASIINEYLKNPNPSTVLILLSGGEAIKGVSAAEPVDCAKLPSAMPSSKNSL